MSFGGSDYDQGLAAMLTLGLIKPGASQAQYIAAFTRWAAAHGYTEAQFGEKWDDYTLAALVAAAQNRVMATQARGPAFTRSRMRGYGVVYRPADSQGPEDYYSVPPAVSVEQAWAQPGSPQTMVPVDQGSAVGIIGGLSNLVRNLFGMQINQAVNAAIYPPGYAVPVNPVIDPTPPWVVPVVAIVGATVLVALARGSRRRRRS